MLLSITQLFSIISLPPGIEVFGSLCSQPANMATLISSPACLYNRLIQLLVLPDAPLLLATLETLYCLTYYSIDMPRLIFHIEGSVKILLDLLFVTVEDLKSDLSDNVEIFEIKSKTDSRRSGSLTDSKRNGNMKISRSNSGTKIGNSSLKSTMKSPSTPVIKTPKEKPQNKPSPLIKVLSSNGKNFIPVLTVQQLQELLGKNSSKVSTAPKLATPLPVPGPTPPMASPGSIASEVAVSGGFEADQAALKW